MIPDYVILTTWFVAAIPVAAFFYFLSEHEKHGTLWSVVATIVIVVIAIGFHIHNNLTQEEIDAKKPIYFGFLEPSNERPLDSTVPADVVVLYLGENLPVLVNSRDLNIFTYAKQPFLTVGSDNGKLWLSATVSDSQNHTVVKIIKNEFQAFPEHAFNPVQPDKHSLVVRDSIGTEVLRVRFLNPRRILIYGVFSLPESQTVVVADNGLCFWPKGTCIEGFTVDARQNTSPGIIDFGPN
jgi:hypothetical protein